MAAKADHFLYASSSVILFHLIPIFRQELIIIGAYFSNRKRAADGKSSTALFNYYLTPAIKRLMRGTKDTRTTPSTTEAIPNQAK